LHILIAENFLKHYFFIKYFLNYEASKLQYNTVWRRQSSAYAQEKIWIFVHNSFLFMFCSSKLSWIKLPWVVWQFWIEFKIANYSSNEIVDIILVLRQAERNYRKTENIIDIFLDDKCKTMQRILLWEHTRSSRKNHKRNSEQGVDNSSIFAILTIVNKILIFYVEKCNVI